MRRIDGALAIAVSVIVLGWSCDVRAGYVDEVGADNPLIYLRFEETSGAGAANSGTLGATHDAALNGDFALDVAGPLTNEASNSALSISRNSNTAALVTNFVVNNPVTVEDFGGPGAVSFSSYSVEFWANSLSPHQGVLVSGMQATDHNNHGIFTQTFSDGTLRFLHRAPPGVSGGQEINPSTQTMTLRQWHHIAVVNDNKNLRLYLDGVQDPVTATALVDFDFDLDFLFGHIKTSSPGRAFNGLVDEFAVYNYALDNKLGTGDFADPSNNRVLAHFSQAPPQSPLPVPPADPVVFGVDFGATGQATHPDFTPVTRDAHSGVGSITTPVPNPFGGGGNVDVTIAEIGDNDDLEFRNDAVVMAGTNFAAVADDAVATRGGDLQLTLSGLPAGEYEFLGYQYRNAGFENQSAFDVEMGGVLMDTGITGHEDGVLNDDFLATSDFTFTATEGEDVVVDFKSRADSGPRFPSFVLLSGFQLKQVPPEFSPDINGDNVVDDADLNLLLSDFGGKYDEDDLAALLADFGRDFSQPLAVGGAQSVPEPGSLVLLLLGMTVWLPPCCRARRIR